MRLSVSVLGIWVCLLAGCGDSQPAADLITRKIGKTCTVQFRRGDGLGAAAELPIGPTTDNYNGASISAVGTLRNATNEWIVLESGKDEYFIPRAAVLMIRFEVEHPTANRADSTHPHGDVSHD